MVIFKMNIVITPLLWGSNMLRQFPLEFWIRKPQIRSPQTTWFFDPNDVEEKPAAKPSVLHIYLELFALTEVSGVC